MTWQVASVDLGTLTAQVRVQAAPVLTFSGTTFTYTRTVVAPDPRRDGGAHTPQTATLAATGAGVGRSYPLTYPLTYGVPAGVTPGSLSLPNAGTASYWPTLRVDGPVTNPQITCNDTGAWVRFNGTVASGTYLTIDGASRAVKLNGAVSVRNLVTSSGDWLAIPPGGASISWTADTADPAALLTANGYEGAWL